MEIFFYFGGRCVWECLTIRQEGRQTDSSLPSLSQFSGGLFREGSNPSLPASPLSLLDHDLLPSCTENWESGMLMPPPVVYRTLFQALGSGPGGGMLASAGSLFFLGTETWSESDDGDREVLVSAGRQAPSLWERPRCWVRLQGLARSQKLGFLSQPRWSCLMGYHGLSMPPFSSCPKSEPAMLDSPSSLQTCNFQ